MSMTLLAIDCSIRQANLLQGKPYHLHEEHTEHTILGSSNFIRSGLGLPARSNIELNLIVDHDSDRVYQAWAPNTGFLETVDSCTFVTFDIHR